MLENLSFYLYIKNLSFPLSKENNLPAKGISDSDITLFIHLLHLCNIKKHLVIIKFLTQMTIKQESTVYHSWPCFHLPLT